MSDRNHGVLVLGAGINGCAIARELLLSGVDVWLVDRGDLASGATAGSSRLIHGGLRYLEFGELDLVRESLAERARLLRLAPQFVRPLRLWIPASDRLGGSMAAVGRFFGWSWWPQPTPRAGRGAWLIAAGLTLYDLYSRGDSLPRHQTQRVPAAGAPACDPRRYRWLSAYYDGQVAFPERLLVSMIADCHEIARAHGTRFRLLTYHEARRRGRAVELWNAAPTGSGEVVEVLEPSLVVNATGAWVDETLDQLEVPSQRLMGGTKGSHLFTTSPRLREALAGQGVYAEARDGRPIFITPLADTILIGTTDERFAGSPSEARCTPAEIEYLIGSVNEILPEAHLTRDDLDFHYSAVRPLPYVDATSTAAITRRHSLVENDSAGMPLVSVVGGKLTTMRSLAESTAAVVLARLGRKPLGTSRDRVFPGGEDYPADDLALHARWAWIAERTGIPMAAVRATWQLYGTRTATVLDAADTRLLLADTSLPYALVQWAIERESARTLADLVERRLMLLYHQRLTRACLEQMTRELAAAGRLPQGDVHSAVEAEAARLDARYGKRVE